MQRTGKNACSFFLLLTKKVKSTKKCILKAGCRPVFSFFLPCKIRHIKHETGYKNKERKMEK